MATTCFFEEVLKDEEANVEMDLELGRSSYYGGESLIYLRVGETHLIMNEKSGRALYAAMSDLGTYLGDDQPSAQT